MKYKYYDKGQRLIAESDSPIQFNLARFPIWKSIKPVVEEDVEVPTNVTKEATEEVAKEEKKTYRSKKRKKTEEDN